MAIVGVLALQGDYELHAERLRELGASVRFIRKPQELAVIEALVIPGGESSTFLKLLSANFRQELISALNAGLPTLGTCAGLILLAKEVYHPSQESLACLDVAVERNSYGRQLDSFVETSLHWTREGRELLEELKLLQNEDLLPITEGVFIRAPRITSILHDSRTSNRPKVKVLLTCNNEPVLVRQGKILGATFHPEVTSNLKIVHQMLLRLI